MRIGFDEKWSLPVATERLVHGMPISRNADGSINIHNEDLRIVRCIFPVFDDVTGQGPGFIIKGDICGKFYSDLADAARAKLDYVSN
jgi:hypothetical protein